MEALRAVARSALAASAIGVLPFAAVKAAESALTRGSIIHFSKSEYALLMAVFTIGLWLASSLVLLCTAAASRRSLIMVPAAMLAFAIIGALVEPRFWTTSFHPVESGLGYWTLIVGICSTLIFATRAREPNVR